MLHRARKHLVPAITAAAVALLALPAGALADSAPPINGDDACARLNLVQPFLPWGDSSLYDLVDNGGFENGSAGWSLTGGGAVVPGNEPFYANSATDGSALSLPKGASATSPPICISQASPYFRFFASGIGDSDSRAIVEVLYQGTRGATKSPTVARLRPDDSWGATDPLPTLIDSTLAAGQTAQIAIRVTSRQDGLLVDDFYVDPWRH